MFLGVFTPDRPHYASLALRGVAVSDTPEEPVNEPTLRLNSGLTIPPIYLPYLYVQN